MDKDLFDMFNDMELDIEEFKKEELSEFEKKKYKKQFSKSIIKNKSNKTRNKIIAVAVSIALIFGFGQSDMGIKVYGVVKEKLKNMTYPLINILNDDNSNGSEYIKIVNQVNNSKNIDIKLTEVAASENRILMALVLDLESLVSELPNYGEEINLEGSKEKTSRYLVNLDYDLIINKEYKTFNRFKVLENNEILSSENKILNLKTDIREIDEEGLYGAKIILDIEDLEKDDLDIELIINEIKILDKIDTEVEEYGNRTVNTMNTIKEMNGEWKFNYAIDKNLIAETESIEIDNRVLFHKEFSYELKEISISPLGISLKGFIDDDKYNDLINKYHGYGYYDFKELPYLSSEYGIVFECETDKGNKFFFRNFSNSVKDRIHFSYDEKGDNFGWNNPLEIETNMDKNLEGVDYIKMTPYYLKELMDENFIYPEINKMKDNSYYESGKPFTIYLNK